MITYLEQVEMLGGRVHVTIKHACRRAGVADTTLARWRSGESTMREDTAMSLLKAIEEIAAERKTPEKATA